MKSNCCPDNPKWYNIGTYANCGEIVTPIIANVTGIHRVLFNFKGNENGFNVFVKAGDPFKLMNIFNENSSTVLRIIEPSGATYIYTYYNCTYGSCEPYDKFLLNTAIYTNHIKPCFSCCGLPEITENC